jgi:hypothetical protein
MSFCGRQSREPASLANAEQIRVVSVPCVAASCPEARGRCGHGQNFIDCFREQGFLMPPDLREWLPEGHLAWFVIDAVAEMDLSAFYAAYRADGHGRAAYEPSMMVALLVYAYARGVRSARAIERVLSAAMSSRRWRSTSWAWSNPNFADHDHGLIDVRSTLLSSQFVSPLLLRFDSVDQVHPPVVGPLNLPQLKPTTSLRRCEERLPFAGDQRMNG